MSTNALHSIFNTKCYDRYHQYYCLAGQLLLVGAIGALLLYVSCDNKWNLMEFYVLTWSLWLTLSTPALQSYVICHTRMRQKFHFTKMLFLPWLTIVLHMKTKENLCFSPKKARAHYNSGLNMCYPLFASRSKFICPKNTNWWRNQEVIILFCTTFSSIDLQLHISRVFQNKFILGRKSYPKMYNSQLNFN